MNTPGGRSPLGMIALLTVGLWLTACGTGAGGAPSGAGSLPVRHHARQRKVTQKHTSPRSRHAHGLPISSMPRPSGMYWTDATTGYLAAQAAVYETTNGGSSWTTMYHSAGTLVSALTGAPSNGVWIATTHAILEISAEGQVIHSFPLPADATANQLVAPSATTLYIRSAGRIYALSGESRHWTDLSGSLGAVDAMAWLTPVEGYAAVGNTVWRTNSGGSSWSKVFSAPVVGPGWTSEFVANSVNSLWLLVSGGVESASQTGFVLWHGTAGGEQWTPITEEHYLAPTGYPTVHPEITVPIMQPGPVAAIGTTTVYFAGWEANRSSDWVFLTNASGAWKTSTIPIRSATPQFFASGPGGSYVSPAALSFVTDDMGFLVGQSTNGAGAMMETQTGGGAWSPVQWKEQK